MLVLSRKPGEKVRIGKDITITILETRGDRARIGIDAPTHVPILRVELTPREDGPAPDRGPEGEPDHPRDATAGAGR
jgi:carbon storage regulator CsrA